MFIITDRAVFAPDEDHSNEFRNEYYTEVDLTTLVISEDLTMRPAYYQEKQEQQEKEHQKKNVFDAADLRKSVKELQEYGVKAESILKKSARSAARKKKAAKPGGRKKKGGAG